MLRTRLLPTFQGVGSQAAGGNVTTASVELEPGRRYHTITLVIGDNGGTTLASGNLIGEIRWLINGSIQRRHLATELNALNSINGAAYALKTSGVAGQAAYRTYLTIFFAEPWRNDNNEVDKLAFNHAGIRSSQLEVDIKAGLTAPVLRGSYEWDPLTQNAPGLIGKVIRQSLPTVGTPQDFNTAIDKKEFIQAISLFPTSDGKYVNKLSFSRNGEIVQDLLDYLENQNKLINRHLNPDTSVTPRFDLVFDYTDPIDDALLAQGSTSLEMHVEFSAAPNGNMPILVQRVGPPEVA